MVCQLILKHLSLVECWRARITLKAILDRVIHPVFFRSEHAN